MISRRDIIIYSISIVCFFGMILILLNNYRIYQCKYSRTVNRYDSIKNVNTLDMIHNKENNDRAKIITECKNKDDCRNTKFTDTSVDNSIRIKQVEDEIQTYDEKLTSLQNILDNIHIYE